METMILENNPLISIQVTGTTSILNAEGVDINIIIYEMGQIVLDVYYNGYDFNQVTAGLELCQYAYDLNYTKPISMYYPADAYGKSSITVSTNKNSPKNPAVMQFKVDKLKYTVKMSYDDIVLFLNILQEECYLIDKSGCISELLPDGLNDLYTNDILEGNELELYELYWERIMSKLNG